MRGDLALSTPKRRGSCAKSEQLISRWRETPMLVAEFKPKYKEVQDKVDAVYTPEQKKILDEAQAKVKADPTTARDVMTKARTEMKVSEDQQTKLTEARKPLQELGTELRKKLDEILTEEQKTKMRAARGGRGGQRGNRGGAAQSQPKQST